MSRESANSYSPQPINGQALKNPTEQPLSEKGTFGCFCPPEIIDSPELARRLGLPESWVRSHVRSRTTDEIPHLKFGRWTRFDWNSPELQEWIADHREGSRG